MAYVNYCRDAIIYDMGLKRRLSDAHDRHARVRASKRDMAQRAWGLLMKVAERQMGAVGEKFTAMGLSPVQAQFLDTVVVAL